jgi:hypothetical protein
MPDTTAKAVATGAASHQGSTSSHHSEDDGHVDTAELSKKSQNPVGDMITVPIETIASFNAPPVDSTQVISTLKPVVPMHLNSDWNLITRAIVPIVAHPADMGPVESYFDTGSGLGDIIMQFYLTPAKPGKWIWGVGPQIQLPTATHEMLGSGKWGAGPAAVLLTMRGHWVVGGLLSQMWSFAGDDTMDLRKDLIVGVKNGMPATASRLPREDVSQTVFQPIINYNLKHGWFLSSSPVMTVNWEADGGNKLTLPVGGGIGKTFHLGKQPMQWTLKSYYNVVRPDNASNWQVAFQVSWLFPKKPEPDKMRTTVVAGPGKDSGKSE